MILDKTGTLTTGEFKVINVDVLSENHTEEEITALMAASKQAQATRLLNPSLLILKMKEYVLLTLTPLRLYRVLESKDKRMVNIMN